MVSVEAFSISIYGKKNKRVLSFSNISSSKTFVGTLRDDKNELNLDIIIFDTRTFFQKLKALIFEYFLKWKQSKELDKNDKR